MVKRDVRLSVDVDKDLHKRLKEKAEKDRETLARLQERALRAYLRQVDRHKKDDE